MSGDGVRSGVTSLLRSRPAWAVPVLLFLAVLLVAAIAFNIANLDAGPETVPAPEGGTSPGSLLPFDSVYADALLLFFVGVFVGLALYLVFTNRDRARRPVRRASWKELLSTILSLALIVALLLLWPRLAHLQPTNETADSTGGSTGTGNPTAWPASVGAPLGLFLAFSVLAAILALTYILRRGAAGGSRREGETVRSDDRREASRAVEATIAELELGADVRGAILACFQRFCRLLGARGITEQGALTPRELERIAVDRLHVAPDASATLTSLFEEARYSEHALQEADRSRAIDSLTGIRAALEA